MNKRITIQLTTVQKCRMTVLISKSKLSQCTKTKIQTSEIQAEISTNPIKCIVLFYFSELDE